MDPGYPCFNTCSSCEEQQVCHFVFPHLFQFQYLLLLRGATPLQRLSLNLSMFQYMLLLRGATQQPSMSGSHCPCFNTCSSCEEQPIVHVKDRILFGFQYMLLLRGATFEFCDCDFVFEFQYMLLLRGATEQKRR